MDIYLSPTLDSLTLCNGRGRLNGEHEGEHSEKDEVGHFSCFGRGVGFDESGSMSTPYFYISY